MEKFLRGAAHFSKNIRPLQKPATPKLLFLTCMDSRLQPHSLTGAVPGDSFVARNPGNFVPHSKAPIDPATYSEAAALEVAVVMAGVEHIVVCGHSDCKALHHLLHTRGQENTHSCCTSWVQKQASHSLVKLDQLQKNIATSMQHSVKLKFSTDSKSQGFEAVIDGGNDMPSVDKLSQISVLQQLVNLQSYDFVQDKLHEGALNIHGWWVDVGKNEIFVFSKEQKKFILVDDDSISILMEGFGKDV